MTPVTSLSRRSQGCTEKQPASGPCLLEGGSQPENQSNSKMFWPEATFYHCCTVYKRNISPCMLLEMSIFSRHVHNTFFRQTVWSGEWTQGLGPRLNFPWPFVASFLCWLSHLGRGKFDKITEFADIARENAHFQQHAWGYISLLKINWGLAMIELCLWSKKSAIR